MQTVYWAHSYRPDDRSVTEHFGLLIESAARLIVNFDPPSASLNAAKLEQSLRGCDGMVAILGWRQNGPSPYILYEISLALRARKPLLVFVDDRLPDDLLPRRILQSRYSVHRLHRQVREHRHALDVLKQYIGEVPPPRYPPNTGRRTCGIVGLLHAAPEFRDRVLKIVSSREYQVLELEKVDICNPLNFEQFECLNLINVVLRIVDTASLASQYWAAAVYGAVVPTISVSTNTAYSFHGGFPKEFQPRLVAEEDPDRLHEVLPAEFGLFEEDFVSAADAEAITRYVKLQVEAGFLKGHYESGTRDTFREVIMGDKINVTGSTVGVVGRGRARDINIEQIWQQGGIDLQKLASELEQLKAALEREATTAEQRMAVSAVEIARDSAQKSDGRKTLEYLRLAGRWAFEIAGRIGVHEVSEALKKVL